MYQRTHQNKRTKGKQQNQFLLLFFSPFHSENNKIIGECRQSIQFNSIPPIKIVKSQKEFGVLWIHCTKNCNERRNTYNYSNMN